MIRVTNHAIQRYQERVEPVSDEIARERLTTPFIQKAIEFGARAIILGTGHRLIVKNNTILSVVLPFRAGTWKGTYD